MCASTLLSFHQLYIICQSNNTRFLQSLEGEAYEHHVVKNHVVGDTIELLELQSSFSREIENEILNMHESKEINEAESEIAANAAVKELERIGSAENISLVEEVAIEVLQSMDEANDDAINQNDKTTMIKNEPDNSNVLVSVIVDASPSAKSKKETARKQKNDDKPKGNAKTRAVKPPKKAVKSPKAEILKENITRSKNKKTERSPPSLSNGKDVKENSFVDSEDNVYVHFSQLNLNFTQLTHCLHSLMRILLESLFQIAKKAVRLLFAGVCHQTIDGRPH